jgi:hypothetical protein
MEFQIVSKFKSDVDVVTCDSSSMIDHESWLVIYGYNFFIYIQNS